MFGGHGKIAVAPRPVVMARWYAQDPKQLKQPMEEENVKVKGLSTSTVIIENVQVINFLRKYSI